MTPLNKSGRSRTENLVYRHLAAQMGVNGKVGVEYLGRRASNLRAATNWTPKVALPEAEYCIAQNPTEALIFHAANLALRVEKIGRVASRYTIEDATRDASKVTRYVATQTGVALRQQYTTGEGLKEVAKFGALGTFGTLCTW